MERNKSRPAAFLDRDGVLIRDHGYMYKPEQIEVLPGVIDGLKAFKAAGYWLIMVSNQAGIAKGFFTKDDVERFHAAMQDKFVDRLGFGLDGLYFCPHHPEGVVPEFSVSCTCRKPGTGMIQQATKDFAINLNESIMVGDRSSDILCGIAAGLKTYQIRESQYDKHPNPFAEIDRLTDIRLDLQSSDSKS